MLTTVRKLLSRNGVRSSGAIRGLSTGAIDVHTHMYLPSYMDVLKKRTEIPRVVTVEGQDRLVILPGEDDELTTATGRPIGREYWDVKAKLEYMDMHNIETSIVSLANPWLTFWRVKLLLLWHKS